MSMRDREAYWAKGELTRFIQENCGMLQHQIDIWMEENKAERLTCFSFHSLRWPCNGLHWGWPHVGCPLHGFQRCDTSEVASTFCNCELAGNSIILAYQVLACFMLAFIFQYCFLWMGILVVEIVDVVTTFSIPESITDYFVDSAYCTSFVAERTYGEECKSRFLGFVKGRLRGLQYMSITGIVLQVWP